MFVKRRRRRRLWQLENGVTFAKGIRLFTLLTYVRDGKWRWKLYRRLSGPPSMCPPHQTLSFKWPSLSLVLAPKAFSFPAYICESDRVWVKWFGVHHKLILFLRSTSQATVPLAKSLAEASSNWSDMLRHWRPARLPRGLKIVPSSGPTLGSEATVDNSLSSKLVHILSQSIAKLTVKLEHSGFGLFALRPAMDLSTAAYRYNQNMMEYYTCKLLLLDILVLFKYDYWGLRLDICDSIYIAPQNKKLLGVAERFTLVKTSVVYVQETASLW